MLWTDVHDESERMFPTFAGLCFVLDNTAEEGHEFLLMKYPNSDDVKRVTNDTVQCNLPTPAIYEAIYNQRAVFAAMPGVVHSAIGGDVCVAELTIEANDPKQQCRVRAANAETNDFSISVIVDIAHADEETLLTFANSIVSEIHFRLGSDTSVAELQEHSSLQVLKTIISQHFEYVIPGPYNVGSVVEPPVLRTCVRWFRPSLPTSALLAQRLSLLEASSRDMATRVTRRSALCVIVASCLFHKGRFIHNHMEPCDAVDTARFCLLNGLLDRKQHDGMTISWHRIYPTRSPNLAKITAKHILSIVSIGHTVLCLQMCMRDESPDGYLDPFYISEMKETLTFLKGDTLHRVDEEIESSLSLLASPEDVPIHYRDSLTGSAVISPTGAKLRQHKLGSPSAKLPIDEQGRKEAHSAHRLTIGDHNVLLHFMTVDHFQGVVMTSCDRSDRTNLERCIRETFLQSIRVIQPLLEDSAPKEKIDEWFQDQDRKDLKESPNASTFSRSADYDYIGNTVEVAAKFEISVPSDIPLTEQHERIWVIGRRVSTATEVYVAMEGKLV